MRDVDVRDYVGTAILNWVHNTGMCLATSVCRDGACRVSNIREAKPHWWFLPIEPNNYKITFHRLT